MARYVRKCPPFHLAATGWDTSIAVFSGNGPPAAVPGLTSGLVPSTPAVEFRSTPTTALSAEDGCMSGPRLPMNCVATVAQREFIAVTVGGVPLYEK
jgi:hypothetical protein